MPIPLSRLRFVEHCKNGRSLALVIKLAQVNEEYLFGRRLDLQALHGGDYVAIFCSFSAQCMRSRFECIHFCAGVYGRSPHVDLPLVAAVGAVDENERGQSEDEGSEEGRLYKEL